MKIYERELLYTLSLLHELPIEAFDSLLFQGQLRLCNYSSKEIVHCEGEPCTHVELVVKGHLTVERIDYSGALLTIALFSRDDLIGGNLVFSSKPFYPLTITSVEKTIVAKIAKEDLFTLFIRFPDFLRVFIRMISENTQILNEKITSHLNRSVHERIAGYLLRESDRQRTDSIVLPYSKKHLSEILGMQRTTLSRELDKMRKTGSILFSGRNITILDIKLLD